MKLEVNFVFPGHGPAFSGMRQKAEAILYHHEQRKSAISRVIQDELKTAYQIAAEIPWVIDVEGVSFQDLSAWDRRLAVMETLAHLQLLVIEDKAKKVVEDNTTFYWGGG